MRFGLVLPPQFRVFGGFFVYRFRKGSPSAAGRAAIPHEVAA